MMGSGKMGCHMDRVNSFMMMARCIKGVSSTGTRTVSRRYTFTRRAHFIEAKLTPIRLTARANFPPITFITKASGSMTCLMVKAGKSTALTHTLKAIFSTAKRKASVCTTGTLNSTIQANSLTISWKAVVS
jgi:hypothetical protein